MSGTMNGNYGLVYPDLKDYYDVNVTNSNFSKLADGIDAVKSGGVKKEVVVAAYNSANKYKEAADFVCTKNDCSDMLAKAVAACCEGGEILFLDGDYYLSKTFTVNKAVRMIGYGPKTRFSTIAPFTGYAMFMIKGDNVTLKDLSFIDNAATSQIHFISLVCNNITVCGCDFTQNVTYSGYISPFYAESYRCRVLIIGCYVRKHNDESWFIYGDKTNIAGVIMGNYCECIDDDSELQIKIMTANVASAKKIKTGAQNTYIFTSSGGVYNG